MVANGRWGGKWGVGVRLMMRPILNLFPRQVGSKRWVEGSVLKAAVSVGPWTSRKLSV